MNENTVRTVCLYVFPFMHHNGFERKQSQSVAFYLHFKRFLSCGGGVIEDPNTGRKQE